LSFRNGVPCVIIRIVFVFRAIVGDALDHYFGVVAAGEGALGVGPIVFGLAFVVAGCSPLTLPAVAKVPGRFGRVFVNRKIAEGVDRIAFLARLHDESFGKLVVGESRQAKHARRICRRQIPAKLICQVVKERLRLILTESAHFPHDLVLAG